MFLLSGLAACDGVGPMRKYTEHCKAVAKHLVRTPSTIDYVRNNSDSYVNGTTIALEFDAENEFGASIRKSIRCLYLTPQEEPVEAKAIVFDGRELTSRQLTVLNIGIAHESRY